jgi:Cytochrome P460
MKLADTVALAAVLAACSGPETPADAPAASFPSDYAAAYVEVRGCRKSADHELDFVRVLADPVALGPYTDRASAFADGAVLLKEQYDPSDDTCSGPIATWTVMLKNQKASQRLGWDWQRVTADRRVVESNAPSCFGCHQGCTGAPSPGYDSTCADP